MKDGLFKNYTKRFNILDENIRELAVKYAEEHYRKNQCSKEEALERGIVKAEMENRKI
ncbi:hypothetical protein LDL79_10980 [Leeuwenhoekiella palythoae]|uniref:Uncharacterized protein n=1 Tax=Galbibacter orientalis DSM 19592 TaxID=926559 RepID=I3C8F3_9FLAO|nr:MULTISPECIES: hypothetical protein [Flavobacteriaceae]EIJ39896.1 hypothetical protein JoomaDRAFT_2938 [Galbibacter orientalis DSM 19592]UBZ09322.1 hypothetical protein LDL79_10980 [Leeuwenhoekiella palythoae]